MVLLHRQSTNVILRFHALQVLAKRPAGCCLLGYPLTHNATKNKSGLVRDPRPSSNPVPRFCGRLRRVSLDMRSSTSYGGHEEFGAGVLSLGNLCAGCWLQAAICST